MFGGFRFKSLAVVAMACGFLVMVEAQPTYAAKPQRFVRGELLVRFRASVDAGERSQALAAANASLERRLTLVPGLQLVKLEDGVTVPSAAASLETRSDVLYAEPNYLYQPAVLPNDSRFGELWGMNNTGQTVNGTAGTNDADIDAPEAWSITQGSQAVTVAIVDTGVAFAHPDLAPNIWTNPGEVAGNGVDDDANGFVDDVRGWDFVTDDNNPRDEDGHGTHVAGTVGARGNNDAAGPGTTDVTGVNWQVKLMPIRFLGPSGGSAADEIDSFEYAAANGARVLNGSFECAGCFSQAILDAITNASQVLFVVAAGNSAENNDTTPNYPCSFTAANLVCVAATNQSDALTDFSNFGATSADLAAPGSNILSTNPSTSYAYLDGTSQATPHVAGVAALIKARFPSATVADLRSRLLAAVDPKPSLSGKVATGGRVNAYRAVAESSVAKAGNALIVTVKAGVKNNLTITRFTDTDSVVKYRVRDPFSSAGTTGSRLSPGPGCVRESVTQVKCTASGLARIIVFAGDQDDSVSVNSSEPLPLLVDGGGGADGLVGGAAADSLTGGTGADSFFGFGGNDTINARTDDVDSIFQCGESAGDSDTVNADATPNDPVSAAANNCEVVNKG